MSYDRWRGAFLISLIFGVPTMLIMLYYMMFDIFPPPMVSLPLISRQMSNQNASQGASNEHSMPMEMRAFHPTEMRAFHPTTNTYTDINRLHASHQGSSFASPGNANARVQLDRQRRAGADMSDSHLDEMPSMTADLIIPGLSFENLILFLLATPVQVSFAN